MNRIIIYLSSISIVVMTPLTLVIAEENDENIDKFKHDYGEHCPPGSVRTFIEDKKKRKVAVCEEIDESLHKITLKRNKDGSIFISEDEFRAYEKQGLDMSHARKRQKEANAKKLGEEKKSSLLPPQPMTQKEKEKFWGRRAVRRGHFEEIPQDEMIPGRVYMRGSKHPMPEITEEERAKFRKRIVDEGWVIEDEDD